MKKIVSKISPENTLFAVPVGIEAARAAYKSFGGQIPIFFANVANPVLEGFYGRQIHSVKHNRRFVNRSGKLCFQQLLNSIGSSSVGHIGIIFNTSEITPMESTNDF
ncbi:MAG: hypothetical protein L6V93_09885 [Clostridiales bacterium]|nr:MAG: hypothetical protein L6V93_09885 [Clostridiales bacterium]